MQEHINDELPPEPTDENADAPTELAISDESTFEGPAVAPKAMSEQRSKELVTEADELANRLASTDGSAGMELVDSVKVIGIESQRAASRQVGLLKTKIAGLLQEGGSSREIAEGLTDLRHALDRLDPNQASRGIAGRVLDNIPFVGRHGRITRSIRRIAVRYEPVSKQVTAIENGLRDAQALLQRDNIELRLIYQEVESAEARVEEDIYLAQLLAERIQQLSDGADDTQRDQLVSAMHAVMMRYQDLREMKAINSQFFIGIRMVRENNDRLAQSVERTVTMATNVVTVGLAIQAALIHEARIREAAARTRQFLGDLIESNATTINRHTQEIGDLYNQPAVALEKIIKAHDQLIEAMETASRLRQDGIAAASKNVAELEKRTEDLDQRLLALQSAEEFSSGNALPGR